MADGDKYIPNGVWLRCDKGAKPGQLTILPKTVKLYGQDWAGDKDAKPTVNIPTFGVCAIIKVCAPATVQWTGAQDDVSIMGQSPILDTCTCQCSVGGTIKIYFTKQAADDAGAEQEAKENAELLNEVATGLLVAAAVVGFAILVAGTGGTALLAAGAIVAGGAAVGGVAGAVQGGITGGAQGAAEGFLVGAGMGALGGIAIAAGGPAGVLAVGAGVARIGSVGFLGKAYYHNPSEEDGLVLVGAIAGMVVGYGTARGVAPRVRTAVRNANVRQATPQEIAALRQTRENLDLNTSKMRDRNVATGRGTIDGEPYESVAVSGTKPKFGTLPPKSQDQQRIRTSPTLRDVERGQNKADRRAHDTEIKILEDVMDKTEGNPNAKGEVTITSELPICPSCYRAITVEFHKHRPNVKINGVETKRPNLPDKLPGRQPPVTPPVVLPPINRDKK